MSVANPCPKEKFLYRMHRGKCTGSHNKLGCSELPKLVWTSWLRREGGREDSTQLPARASASCPGCWHQQECCCSLVVLTHSLAWKKGSKGTASELSHTAAYHQTLGLSTPAAVRDHTPQEITCISLNFTQCLSGILPHQKQKKQNKKPLNHNHKKKKVV